MQLDGGKCGAAGGWMLQMKWSLLCTEFSVLGHSSGSATVLPMTCKTYHQ